MKKYLFRVILSAAKNLALMGLVVGFFACGDDSNSTSASGENSALSSAVEDDESSSSINDNSSSSSVIPSDSEGSSSSSSVKADGKSSSSNHEINSSSSSQSEEINCKWFCTSECEGSTRWRNTTTKETCRNGEWLNIDSLENLNKSSSSYYDMSEQFNPDIEYGSMTDPRDGKVYKTVRVEYGYDDIDSITIFAENLNYGKQILGGTVQSDSTKYCYNDDPWYCDNGFGGLYSWSNAMNFTAACDSNAVGTDACPEKFDYINDLLQHQGICPDGWHVMGTFAWNELLHITHFPDGSLFRSTHGSKAVFGGSNEYGVSILPGGYWNEEFKSIGQTAIFWTPIQSRDYPERANYIAIHSSSFNRNQALPKVQGYSIRCVQNYDRE